MRIPRPYPERYNPLLDFEHSVQSMMGNIIKSSRLDNCMFFSLLTEPKVTGVQAPVTESLDGPGWACVDTVEKIIGYKKLVSMLGLNLCLFRYLSFEE